ncbi:methylenetetrahydrofolate reductase C-terminal domain-containing protein [Sporomusa acidovorans]|uniref:Methylenetetrahydrofolate reductase n=1 Tax=Sporomusa acidovorans (strain ATCC 49682 / DSM 3132 / Mol) TaxID=1123286 RepID=A0ABZ3J670_SPOA4|nr:methylenetetrahydrofolate reductase C-terminal domain-containing protein [Sporomusa acidovorans]OZC24304.1 bifunctional homocysteine S-methyltransferase/5,10-methylenetetrahydrofolate reductase [Sporomusa acidovorans DSM 3132]SDF02527.1 methylenetetrahydrofolate reductase (NADPH) [Sporomusa acidovorans]
MTAKLSLKAALAEPTQLSVTWELVPGRGAREKAQEHLVRMAELAAKDARINAVTITDNPSGKSAITAYAMAVEAKRLGIDPLVHFTTKDRNRNALESELYALDRADIENLLVMTGDYPVQGYAGNAKPVFDFDAVHALRLIAKMNDSTYSKLTPTHFFAGAVVSPFKSTEAETMAQYYKLHKKVASSAGFIITQLGYDARKFDEVKKYVTLNNLAVPLIGNIFVLSLPVARLMNKNLIPGCVVTDSLLARLEEEAVDSNKKELQLLRAARQYAVLKGLQYDGVNIGGHGLGYDDVRFIMEKGEELSANWQDIAAAEFNHPQADGFYFFEKDAATGLNTCQPVDRSRTTPGRSSLKQSLMDKVHALAFDQKAPLHPVNRAIAGYIDKSWLKQPFTMAEYITKTMTNECRFCGDCAMHELGFICPMSQCPKQQRNGACGGSRDGWCEVYPGKRKCIYVRMYEGFKGTGREERMKEKYMPPCNWELYRTSSWLNYFNDRDYNHNKD